MNSAAPPPVAQVAAPENTDPIRILISRRTERETVIDIQTYLNQLGFSTGTPDGLVGTATIQAINTFKALRPAQFKGDKALVSDTLLREVYAAAGKGEPPNGIIMVRQGFMPVFEAPLTIDNPRHALGTHFFALHAVDAKNGKAEWLGVTLKNDLSRQAMKRLGIVANESSIVTGTPIANALDRITIPDETRRRIGGMLAAGSTLTISDTGIGPETGAGTDFITITR
jgi:hypothetical protein